MHTFLPLPFLRNPHVQTVLGNLLPGPALTLSSVAEVVGLADGDRVVIHESAPFTWREDEPIAVLVHGLGGCHGSANVVRVAQRLANRGVRVCRMDLRGSAGITLGLPFLLGGPAATTRAVLDHLHARHPASPLLLAGYSLGGGIVCRLAGEAADRPVAGLCAVAALAPPLDLVLCSELIARQRWYDAFFVRSLTRHVLRHQQIFSICRASTLAGSRSANSTTFIPHHAGASPTPWTIIARRRPYPGSPGRRFLPSCSPHATIPSSLWRRLNRSRNGRTSRYTSPTTAATSLSAIRN